MKSSDVEKYKHVNAPLTRGDKKSVFDTMGGPDTKKGVAVADVKDVDPSVLNELMCVCLDSGGAFLMSRTTDRGAFSFTFFVGDDRKRVYCPGTQDINAFIREWVDFYRSLIDIG